jgi:hypothetical protein
LSLGRSGIKPIELSYPVHNDPENQGTLIGISCLILCAVPIVGIVINWIVVKKFPNGTNANTCATIGIVISWLIVILGVAP